jgi:DNA-binding NarL/FixJ family response regulator
MKVYGGRADHPGLRNRDVGSFEPKRSGYRDAFMDGGALGVLLSCGEPIFLRGLRAVLEEAGGFEIIATCTSGDEALEIIERSAPDVVVSGIQLRGFEGLGLLRAIRARELAVPVVVVSPALTQKELLEALSLGVNGVLLNELPPELVVRCLRKVGAGGYWFEHQSMKGALDSIMHREAARRRAREELTAREIELVCLAAEGLRNKQIAERLGITEATVKTHIRNIYKKLNRDTRLALRRYAEERGLV